MLPVTTLWFVVYLCQYFSSQKPLRQLLPGTSFAISTFSDIIGRRQFSCNSNTKTHKSQDNLMATKVFVLYAALRRL